MRSTVELNLDARDNSGGVISKIVSAYDWSIAELLSENPATFLKKGAGFTLGTPALDQYHTPKSILIARHRQHFAPIIG